MEEFNIIPNGKRIFLWLFFYEDQNGGLEPSYTFDLFTLSINIH